MQDFFFIGVSIVGAVMLSQSGLIASFVDAVSGASIVASFVAGIFFTSFFTTAPAIVTLSQVASTTPLWIVVLFGALGAVCGDLIIFRFIRDHFIDHLQGIFKLHRSPGRRLSKILALRWTRWILFLVAGLIIASPFPDELGLGLLSMTGHKFSSFALISFMANAFGILVIGMLSRI